MECLGLRAEVPGESYMEVGNEAILSHQSSVNHGASSHIRAHSFPGPSHKEGPSPGHLKEGSSVAFGLFSHGALTHALTHSSSDHMM